MKKLFAKALKICLIRLELLRRRIIFHFWGTTGTDTHLVKVHDYRMLLSSKDCGSSFDLWLDGTREDFVAREYRNILKPGMVIADIGANIGYYALMAAKAVGEKGFVHAIEPVPDNCFMLKRNIGINDFENICINQLAIGNEIGNKRFFLSDKSNLGNFLHPKEGDAGWLEVQVNTLDNFLVGKRKPDFVRMDIEGHEFEALKGMQQTLSKAKEISLFVEMHNEDMGKETVKDFYGLLKACGFERVLVVRNPPNHLQYGFAKLFKQVFPPCEKFEIGIDELLEREELVSKDYYIIARKGSRLVEVVQEAEDYSFLEDRYNRIRFNLDYKNFVNAFVLLVWIVIISVSIIFLSFKELLSILREAFK